MKIYPVPLLSDICLASVTKNIDKYWCKHYKDNFLINRQTQTSKNGKTKDKASNKSTNPLCRFVVGPFDVLRKYHYI